MYTHFPTKCFLNTIKWHKCTKNILFYRLKYFFSIRKVPILFLSRSKNKITFTSSCTTNGRFAPCSHSVKFVCVVLLHCVLGLLSILPWNLLNCRNYCLIRSYLFAIVCEKDFHRQDKRRLPAKQIKSINNWKTTVTTFNFDILSS